MCESILSINIMRYKIEKSNRKYKKYKAVFKTGPSVHFGDNRYEQYKDSTKLGLYKKLDHGDEKRRRLYYARHGDALYLSAKWFSHKYLW
jgi:hypothetical protein